MEAIKEIQNQILKPDQRTLNIKYSYLLNQARDQINREMQEKYNSESFKPLDNLSMLDYQILYDYTSICDTIHYEVIHMYISDLLHYIAVYNLSLKAFKPFIEFINNTNNIYMLNNNRFGTTTRTRQLTHKLLNIPYKNITINYDLCRRIINRSVKQ